MAAPFIKDITDVPAASLLKGIYILLEGAAGPLIKDMCIFSHGPAAPFIKGIYIVPEGAAASSIRDIPDVPAASLLKGIYILLEGAATPLIKDMCIFFHGP